MSLEWCYNAKTGEIFSYTVSGEITDFPRGDFLVYQDYLITGFDSKREAVGASEDYGACLKCKTARAPNTEGNCYVCGQKIKFTKLQVR